MGLGAPPQLAFAVGPTPGIDEVTAHAARVRSASFSSLWGFRTFFVRNLVPLWFQFECRGQTADACTTYVIPRLFGRAIQRSSRNTDGRDAAER
jgi:hypothetical protein